MGVFERAPIGWRRVVLRAPVLAYHLGLGRLLGHRFLLLVHRGRRTGLVRENVLEVIDHEPATGRHVVVSGWGPGSDWVRNLRAAPALEVRSGGERFVPDQRFLDVGEAVVELRRYRDHHARAFGVFARSQGVDADADDATLAAWAADHPMVAFTPRHPPGG